MGLLDTMSDDGYGLLSMGLRMMSTPGNFGQAFGQAGLGAMGDVRQFAADKQRRAMADLQTQQARMQMEEMARQERERQALQNYATQALTPTAPIDANNASGVMGPRPEALKAVGQVPGFNLGSALKAGVPLLPAMQVAEALKKTKPQPIKVGKDETLLDPETFAPVFQNQTPDKGTTDMQNYRFGSQDPAFLNFLREQANLKAPKTTLNVNSPDKIWERENTVRKEFNSLPEVTRYKAALPAFKAVESAASRNGPQADINLIYGLAKLYDPESVVREGEYDTIAKSQSIPERVKSIAQQLSGGGSLTPETKRQLLIEAKQRIGTFKQEHDGARATYEGIVRSQGGNPASVFTPIGAEQPSPSLTQPKSRLVKLDDGTSVNATLGEDGMYYVKRNGKTFRVED